jgi:AraC family transcriptional regulator of adaptative response/methylated-DNA-[protein]-cysteine methyltransferase
MILDAEKAWSAVLERDVERDGSFVYAVRSTKIYCRPSCPARRPLRENVSFFPAAQQAEAAGFRPCRRCHPGAEKERSLDAKLARARALLESELDRTLPLGELAARVGLSASHLQRAFKARYGLSPRAHAAALRLERFKRELPRARSVTEALYDAGYGSSRALYARAAESIGMTPSAYRRGGEGVALRYAIARCSLGKLLIAQSTRGVCAVLLGRTAAELEEELAREFPRADRVREPELDARARAALRAVEGSTSARRLALDLGGTEFQRRVWSELCRIPKGETRSYREVAEQLGSPTSARAVARACAQNRAAVVVPCHRVLRADGALSGYRWGASRKRRLLAREKRGSKA